MTKKMKKSLSVLLALVLSFSLMLGGFMNVSAEDDEVITDDETQEITSLSAEPEVEDEETVVDDNSDAVIEEEPTVEDTTTDEETALEEETTSDEVIVEEEPDADSDEYTVDDLEEEDYGIMTLADGTVSTAEEFKKAVESATDNETVTLAEDIEISASEGNCINVSAAITIDLGGHTILVTGGSNASSLFEVTANNDNSAFILTVENGILDGNSDSEGHAIYLEKNSNASLILKNVTAQYFAQSAVYANYSGDVTATYCTFTGNEHTKESSVFIESGAGIFMYYSGSLTVENSKFLNNTALGYGGGISLYYKTGNVELAGNTFENNTAKYGGGFSAEGVTGNMIISNNEITKNIAEQDGGGFRFLNTIGDIEISGNTITENKANCNGGGLALSNSAGKLTMTGNTFSGNVAGQGGGGDIENSSYNFESVEITDNEFSSNKATNDSAKYNDGGGLNFYEEKQTAANSIYDFSGNTFKYNIANRYGGGLNVYSDNAELDIVIRSGLYYENTGEDGGGISYVKNVTGYPPTATLSLYNAIITGNEAKEAGGGMWFCPYSGLAKSVTMGVAIYGNSAGDAGDDFYRLMDEVEKEDNSVHLSYRALGGMLMEWYSDEEGARYKDGAGTLYDYDSEIFTGTEETFGAHAVLSDEAIALAKEEAALYIYNNYASEYGGGIASNNPVEFGDGTDMIVEAGKVWKDKDGNVLTSKDINDFSVDVTLVRVDEDGKEVDLETVTLNEADNWTWDFENLPTRYIGEDGEEHLYTFTTREVTHVDSFSPAYEVVTDEDGNEEITITNREQEFYKIDEEIVDDTDDIFNRDKYEKKESVNEYNAIEIEMSTYLPYMTAQDLIDSTYTMNFHNVLDSELILDEADADFSVYIAGQKIDHMYYTVTTASSASLASIQTFSVGTSIDDGCSFHVDVDLSALYADGVIDESNLVGNTEISVFFFVDLERIGLNVTYKSTVWYEVYEDDTVVYTSNVDTIEVYTFEIEIQKVDSQNGNVLSDATFGLYYDSECTDAVIRNEEAYTVTSDESGMAIFYGLAGGTYYVKELTAPEGICT